MLCFVDGTETAFTLVDGAKRYLSSIGNVENSDRPLASVGIAIAASHDTLDDCVVQGLNGIAATTQYLSACISRKPSTAAASVTASRG